MAMSFRVQLSIVILLPHLVKLSPSPQWTPYAGGSPGSPQGLQYRNVNGGNFLPVPPPSSAAQFYSPSPVYPGSGGGVGGNIPQNFQSSHQPDLSSLSLTGYPGASALANGHLHDHLYSNPNLLNQGLLSSSQASSSSSLPSNSKSVSGDFCFDPLLSCDTPNTVLYCIQSRCTCPTQWTLKPGTLPLNTVWHPDLRRCMSTIGSGCHLVTTSYYPNMSPALSAGARSPHYNSAAAGAPGGTTFDHSELPSSSSSSSFTSSATQQIASTIIKGLIGIPPGAGGGSGGGQGYVFCQPGLQCVRQSGSQETGICAGTSNQNSSWIILFSFLSISVLHQFYNYT